MLGQQQKHGRIQFAYIAQDKQTSTRTHIIFPFPYNSYKREILNFQRKQHRTCLVMQIKTAIKSIRVSDEISLRFTRFEFNTIVFKPVPSICMRYIHIQVPLYRMFSLYIWIYSV